MGERASAWGTPRENRCHFPSLSPASPAGRCFRSVPFSTQKSRGPKGGSQAAASSHKHQPPGELLSGEGTSKSSTERSSRCCSYLASRDVPGQESFPAVAGTGGSHPPGRGHLHYTSEYRQHHASQEKSTRSRQYKWWGFILQIPLQGSVSHLLWVWFKTKVSWPDSLYSQERDQERWGCDPKCLRYMPEVNQHQYCHCIQTGISVSGCTEFSLESVKVKQSLKFSSKWFSFVFLPPAGGITHVLLVCTHHHQTAPFWLCLPCVLKGFMKNRSKKHPRSCIFLHYLPPKQGWQEVLQGRLQQGDFQRPQESNANTQKWNKGSEDRGKKKHKSPVRVQVMVNYGNEGNPGQLQSLPRWREQEPGR